MSEKNVYMCIVSPGLATLSITIDVPVDYLLQTFNSLTHTVVVVGNVVFVDQFSSKFHVHDSNCMKTTHEY